MTTEKEDQLVLDGQKPSEPSKEAVLIQSILNGEEEASVRVASELSREMHESNGVIDAISEAMNIATDLHEVEKYTAEQVEKSEHAAEKALDAVKNKIRVEQKRIHGKVMVASLTGDPHSFEHTLMLTMLKACGFTPMDGGADLTPEQLAATVKSHKPDVLAIPLVTPVALEQLRDCVSILNSTRKKRDVGIVAFGRGTENVKPDDSTIGSVETDSLRAVSKITELLISQD